MTRTIPIVLALLTSLSLLGEESPRDVARMLYVDAVGGDASSIARMSVDGKAPARVAEFQRLLRVKCLSLPLLAVGEARVTDDRAVVPVDAAVERADRFGGPTIVDGEHGIVSMKLDHGAWLIDGWKIEEEDFVARLAALKSGDAIDAEMLANPQYLDGGFARALRVRYISAINTRKFDEAKLLLHAVQTLAALSADDIIRSHAHVSESILLRVGPKVDIPAALTHANEALSIAERVGDADLIASAMTELGRVYQWRDGASGNAVPLFERIIAMRDRLADEGSVERAAAQISVYAQERGDIRATFANLEVARSIATRLHDVPMLQSIEIATAELYIFENDCEVAMTHLNRAQEYAQQAQFQIGIAATLLDIAHCEFWSDNTKLAKAVDQAFQYALKINKPEYASTALTEIGLAHLRGGRVDEADKPLQDAVTYGRQGVEQAFLANALEGLGRVRLAQKRYAEALPLAEEALIIRRKHNVQSQFGAWVVAAAAHHALGNRAAAYQLLREAMQNIEITRESITGNERQLDSFFTTRSSVYTSLASMLIEDRQYGEALMMVEHSKGRTLLDALATERKRAGEGIPAAEKKEEARLEHALIEANRAVTEARLTGADTTAHDAAVTAARTQLDTFRAALDSRFPRLAALRGVQELQSIDSLVSVLAPRTAIIEFAQNDDNLEIFVITPGAKPSVDVHVVTVKHAVIDDLARDVVRRFAGRDALYRDAAKRLYDLTLRPVENVIRASRAVCVIPDGGLWAVPFEALIDGDGKFVLERTAFYYAPSAAALAQLARHSTRSNTPRAFLGFGNPQLNQTAAVKHDAALYRGAAFGPLPDAEREVESIGKIFGANRSAVYVGANALESRAKQEAPRYRVIHFATHGIFDDQSPMYSHLILARESNAADDGILEAREMLDLHLDADLVVLSACDTARGNYELGEGIIGMSWALFAGGVRSVIASQWSVNSSTTESLMVNFYRDWLRSDTGVLAKAEALRDARLKVMHSAEHRHPYYWAPFVLVGTP